MAEGEFITVLGRKFGQKRVANDLRFRYLRPKTKTMENKETGSKDGEKKNRDQSFCEYLREKYYSLPHNVPKDAGVTKVVISKGPIFF